jgi:glycosyltransferase involved in cell wall biosynthesis
MKYLMVSSYPPSRCGIGKYASQMAASLREKGHVVTVLGVDNCHGDCLEDLHGWFRVMKVIKYSRGYDRIVIQYHESFFYSYQGRFAVLSRFATSVAFCFLFLALKRKVVTVLHELTYERKGLKGVMEGIKWHFCPKIVFHTRVEKEEFERSFSTRGQNEFEIVDHKEWYREFRQITKKEARAELGIAEGYVVFLCIGFIQHHKGFDRAIRAFKNVNSAFLRLYIVGSVRLEYYERYLDDLKRLAADAPNVFVIDECVADEVFDTWLIACDCVVLPYRKIWSSAVAARAKLFGKPIVASDVGGLKEQLGENDILFKDDGELRFVFEEFGRIVDKKKEEDTTCSQDEAFGGFGGGLARTP